jgi:hypothetical protein
MDADLLSSDLECLGTGTAAPDRSHEMTSWSEVTIEHRVGNLGSRTVRG